MFKILKDLRKEFFIPSKRTQKQYDLIFGCLFSSMENVSYKNMYLGAYSMKADNSCNKVLIVEIFFKLPKIIQMSILTESFRVARKVCIESKEITKIKEFIQIAVAAGIVIEYKIEKDTAVRFLYVFLLDGKHYGWLNPMFKDDRFVKLYKKYNPDKEV